MGTLTTALRRDASGRTFPLPTPFSSPHSWLRATPESCDELRCSTSRARHRRTSCPSAWRRYERASVACGHPCRTFLRSEEHTSELQSRLHLVCRLLLEKKKTPRPRVARRGAWASTSSSTAPSHLTG